jgi:hypothetical protein
MGACVRAAHILTDWNYRLALSSTRWTHAVSVSPAFAAVRWYRSRRSSLMRIVSQWRLPFSTGGLPRGFLGCSIGRIVYQQIILDNPS